MKFDFNTTVTGIDGEVLKDDNGPVKMNTQLSNLLMYHVSGSEESAVRYYEWALKLREGKEPLELTTTDQKEVRKFVGEHKGLSNLVKAQILLHMDQVVSASKTKK